MPPARVLQASLQDAAAHLSPCPATLRRHFVTPAPIAQPLKHQEPKIVKSPLFAELDIYTETWFTVKRRWNLLLIRVCYLVRRIYTAPARTKHPGILWM